MSEPGPISASAAETGDPTFAVIAAPEAAPLFWHGSRVGVDSAWYGHVPFGHWIVAATRPRNLVELGTHAGVSYFAFCEAVFRCKLSTRCLAIDTWQGDAHSGFYGEDIFMDLSAANHARFSAFSELLRSTFDDALAYVPDGSVDLLHIDGRHLYEDVRHDFHTWKPKLSPRAVVLFHDTNVRDRNFGVWKLWAELVRAYPTFEFLHEHGLGVLAAGDDVPAPVARLCRTADDGAIALIRERFAFLGQLIRLEAVEARQRRTIEDQRRAIGNQQQAIEAQQRAVQQQYDAIVANERIRAEQQRTLDQTLAAERELRAENAAAKSELAACRAELEKTLSELDAAHHEREAARGARASARSFRGLLGLSRPERR